MYQKNAWKACWDCSLGYGLVDNKMDNMHVYFDRDMLEEHDIMTLHPNDNTKTIFFPMEDCFKILDAQCYTYTIIDI